MKCGACNTKLKKETDEYENAHADWWICEKCNVARELGPYDKPETDAEQEQWDKLFKGKKYFKRLDWSLEQSTERQGQQTNYNKFVGDGSGIIPSPCNKCAERAVYADRSSPPKCQHYPVGIPTVIHARKQECEHFVDARAVERLTEPFGFEIIKKE